MKTKRNSFLLKLGARLRCLYCVRFLKPLKIVDPQCGWECAKLFDCQIYIFLFSTESTKPHLLLSKSIKWLLACIRFACISIEYDPPLCWVFIKWPPENSTSVISWKSLLNLNLQLISRQFTTLCSRQN